MGEDIVAKYSGQLADLKMNSKPLINLLTMMAEDYIRDAPTIVQVIEKHLQMVKAETKLPVLYLIDSIIKNVRKDYVELFTQNVVSTFCGVFEKVDEKTRGLLFKLRGTWKDYFPAKKLYAIDVRCRQIDPNWPVMAPPPATGNIHVNPRFLNRGKPPGPVIINPERILAQTSTATTPPIDTNVSDVQMRAQLLAKQKELLELQTKKVELELLQAELQMKAKAQQEELSAKQIDIAQKQERMLLGMAETAKSRTQEIQQQLSTLHHKPPTTSTSLKTKVTPSLNSHDSSSDRESRHNHSGSAFSKHKANSETSSNSTDSSPSKKSKSSSREKSERDRKDRSKSDKSSKDKDKDKHDSKESQHSDRESRHSHSGSASSKHIKANSEASSSSTDGSPSKKSKSSSRDKSERDRKDKSKSEKSSKDKDKHESKDPRLSRREKSSRHDSSKDKNRSTHRTTDLRGEVDGALEPPHKKPKPEPDSAFDEANRFGEYNPHIRVSQRGGQVRRSGRGRSNSLFGHQDVDLRAASSCWTQVKVKSESIGDRESESNTIDEDERMGPEVTKILRSPGTGSSRILRSPGPTSPDVPISQNVACDPLGRPLIYNRLPNDPEERKRNLDSRSSSIDPIEQFRARYVDRALQATGQLSNEDMKVICVKAKEELDQGYLNNDQYLALMRQVVQDGSKASEAIALREAQQMQMNDSTWQMPKANHAPNPWVAAAENTENNIWAAAANIAPVAGQPPPMGMHDFPRFPGPNPGPLPGPAWMQPAPAGPNPFEEAIARPMMVEDMIPKANPKELRIADMDVGRTIPIDKVMREIRFYRDLSVIFMGAMNDDPRELSFQRDEMPRTVLINGKPLEIYLGETKKFDLNRVPHTLRIGSPGRELVVDDRRFELFFGGVTKKIYIDSRPHAFQLLPPSPQVTVGQVSRHDLCAGKVMLTIDAVHNVPVFLDEKIQKIEILGEPVILRFCNGFQTVTLNGKPFPTNFGARLPFSITIQGHGKHFLRFAAISGETERAIQEYIAANYGDGKSKDTFLGYRGILRRRSSDSKRALVSLMDNVDLDLEFLGGRGGRGGYMRGGLGARGRRGGRGGQREMPMDVHPAGVNANPWESNGPIENVELTSSAQVNPLDLLNNYFHSSTPDPHSKTRNNLNHSYESDLPGIEDKKEKETEAQGNPESNSTTLNAGNVNVSDLVANLIKFGLLPGAPTATTEQSTDNPKEEKSLVDIDQGEDSSPKEQKPAKVEKEAPKPIPPLPFVDMKFTDNLKERRDIVIGQISTGVQCSQCGLRFPPDQTLRYSQHLDWHFRKNRREKANARKALSRKWYYDLSDWIQFEEIEDLEERAASLFESQEAENESDPLSPSAILNPEEYTVLASAHEGAVCPQCGETFESFFDEEREEWRLKNAKLDEDEGEQKLYHPICHQDYLRSLMDESVIIDEEPEPTQEYTASTENKENDVVVDEVQQEDDDEVLIIKEGKKEVVLMEIDIDDDVEKTENVLTVSPKSDENSISHNNVNDETKKTDNITIVIDEENINNVEKDGEKSYIGNDSSSLDANVTLTNDKLRVDSPILIDEDSSFLPGLSDEAQDGVFGIALNSGSQREKSSQPVEEEKRIIYEAMKFDFPPVKVEPPDEDDGISECEDAFLNSQDFVPLKRFSKSGGDDDSEPMNIDLTEEDSNEAVDSGARLVMQIRTSIDGNLQHEDAAALPFIPAPKIKINLFGVDNSPVSSPKEKEKVDSPQPQQINKTSADGDNQDGVVKDDGNSNNVVSKNSEINKDDNPDEPVLTEEMKRLKPRLVGRKLTNYPPKFKGKEESGLCVIC